MEMNVTENQMALYEQGLHIHKAFPHLTAGEREFILTGVTDEEWKEMFPPEEEEEEIELPNNNLMPKLIKDGWTYYHTTITTSPFGGQTQDRTLMKIDSKGNIVKLTSEEWDKEIREMDIDHSASYDMVYTDPFVDYR